MRMSWMHLPVAALSLCLVPATAAAVEPPEHWVWADEMVDTVTPAANNYGDPAALTWSGENGLGHSTARVKCASFLTELLERAYAVDMVGWFGCTSPHAASYHDAILDEDGFTEILSVDAIQPGDVVAIRYHDANCTQLTCGTFENCTTTGHIAIAAAAPTKRTATAPLVAGTVQYDLEIFDSSTTPHGSGDTRWQAGTAGAHDQGTGRGTMRLYAAAADAGHPIVGHTWSTSSGSSYHGVAKRDVVVGRYTP